MNLGFVPEWRRRKSAAFDLTGNSTAGHTVELDLWGRPATVYANANFSIYSAQTCNARCHFCVEELRPASRGLGARGAIPHDTSLGLSDEGFVAETCSTPGTAASRLRALAENPGARSRDGLRHGLLALEQQRTIEADDARYFAALEAALDVLRPLAPTISITGGEPSKDPRLPNILAIASRFSSKRRSLTTNGSGLLDVREGQRVIDHVIAGGIEHLNISRAHPDHDRNAQLMVLREGLSATQLREVVTAAAAGGGRVRLSCVLVDGAIDSLARIREYLHFAESLGVDNVIFRQLMHVDRDTVADNFVVKFSDRRRTRLEPLLDQITNDPEFSFTKQIVGYYYYVEVWRFRGIDVVFEEADLAQLERTKHSMPGVIHELIFHPNAKLASTWQPWDGVLGPPQVDA